MSLNIRSTKNDYFRQILKDGTELALADTVTFHNGTTEASDGVKFKVGAYKTVVFGINGTSSTRTIQFRAIDAAGNDNLLLCSRTSDNTAASSTTAEDETWEANVAGMEYFYLKITAISAASAITARGKAVA